MATNNKILKCPPLRFPDFNDDWTQCCISDYGDIVTGSTPSTSDPENYQENGFLWASPADINESKFIEATKTTLSLKGFNSTRKLPPYTVLVVCIGSTIGKMAMSKTIMATNQQINSIVVCEKYSPEFVYYAIDSRFPQYLTSVAVQAVPIISKSTFGALESCAPTLAEQKKIADFLSLIDERIQSCSETLKERKREKAGLLNQLFSQKLRFPDFNDEWTQTTLGEILSLAPQIPIDKPCIKDIISVKLHGKGISRTSATTLNLGATQYYLRRAGQLIYGKQNFHNGAIALIPKEYDNGITSKDIPSFVFDTTKSSPKYVLAYLLRVKYYEATEIYTTGTGSKRLKEDSFFSLPISLPTLEEQKKIADFLSLIDERIEVEEQLLKKYEEQKKYLLRHMFV